MNNKLQKISIILPTLNEAKNLKILIPQIIEELDSHKEDDFEVIVVDDGSTDNTKDIVDKLNEENSNIRLINRKTKPSLPMSIWDGIENSKYEHVLWMDADLSMPANTVKKLINKLSENNDSIVIGSRFSDGGAYKGILELENRSFVGAILNVYKSNDTVLGMILSNVFNKVLRKIYKSNITDITSGFIVGKKSYFKKEVFQNSSYGEYFIYLVNDIVINNINVIEIGYICETRRHGSSKTATSLYQLIKRGYPYIRVARNIRKINEHRR